MLNDLHSTVKKLKDESLKNISGGKVVCQTPRELLAFLIFLMGVTVGGAIGAVGCGIASTAQFTKGNCSAGATLAVISLACAGVIVGIPTIVVKDIKKSEQTN